MNEAPLNPQVSKGFSWQSYTRQLSLLGTIILLTLIFWILAKVLKGNNFLSFSNVQIMASHTVITALGAIGMTLVIVSGGIDLSIGSVIALSMVVTAWGVERLGVPLEVAVLMGLLAGSACGLVSGLIIVWFRLLPFIATLGMMGIARGLAKVVAERKPINLDYKGWEDSWLKYLTVNPSNVEIEGLPYLPSWILFQPAVWVTLLFALVMAAIFSRHIFGRHVFAVGSNESAARLCGVQVSRVKVLVYTICGLFAGIAGVIFASRQSQGDPTAAVAYELHIIAAVVIGGGSLTGGEGSIFGSIAGAVIITIIRSGLRSVQVTSDVQEILIGVIIVGAAILDRWQHRKKE